MQLLFAAPAALQVRSQFARQLTSVLAVAGTLALLALAALLLVRRMAGAFAHPLPAVALLAAAVVLTVYCLVLHGLWQQLSLARSWRFIAALVLAVAYFLAAIAITLPGSPQAPLATLWALLVSSQGLALLVAWRGWPPRHSPRRRHPAAPAAQLRNQPPSIPTGDLLEPEHDEICLPSGVTQRLTHSRDAAGSETIYGALRETFAPGQRTANLHVAFCPPLAGVPELAVEQLEGPEVAVKTGELQPYGARLDLRLKRASSESVEVLLEFTVVAPGAP